MREIKFRAKCLGTGKLICFDLFSLSTKDGILYANAIGIDPDTIQQYIGLKNKNGVEIYEGDRVQEYQMRYDDEDNWVLLPFDEPDVVTMERFPVYWLEREEFGYEGEDLKKPEDFEVIDNIYENPELLKGQDNG